MTLGEWIKKIADWDVARFYCELELNAYTQHHREKVKDMDELHRRFVSVCNPDYKDNRKIFVLLAFFFYDPKLLYGHRRVPKGKIRKEIGRVLGISGSSVTRYFADAKSLLKNHKGFREEIERVFAALGVD